jgi:hypothetical protein
VQIVLGISALDTGEIANEMETRLLVPFEAHEDAEHANPETYAVVLSLALHGISARAVIKKILPD